MYIHLVGYEPIPFARVALFVREFSADGAGVDIVLRGGAAPDRGAGYAAHHPASFGAGGGGVAGAAGGNAGDGQHFVDAHAGDYPAAGVGCGAAGQRSTRTSAAAVAGRSGKTETRDTCLERAAGALERQIGRARLEKPFAADESGYGAGGGSGGCGSSPKSWPQRLRSPCFAAVRAQPKPRPTQPGGCDTDSRGGSR
jgi:hypothetical protein